MIPLKILKASMIVQLLMYGWAMQINYSHANDNSLDGLIAIIPMMIFVALGLIDLLLIIVYVIEIIQKKAKLDPIVLLLVSVIVLLVLFYNRIYWIITGSN